MKDVFDFAHAALPWIGIGLLLAVFFAQSTQKKKKKNETYSTEGMALGMCFGVAIGTAFGNHTDIGLPFGMLAGLIIGDCVEKKKTDSEDEQ